MKTNPNDPIEWRNCIPSKTGRDLFPHRLFHIGLTKREYFAAIALQGILSNASYMSHVERWTYLAVTYADHLVDELNKDTKQDGKE